MIIQIDDKYFNPLQITCMTQQDKDVYVYFTNSSLRIVFKNWNITELAAQINDAIKEFDR